LQEVLEDLHPKDAASILSGLEDPEIVEIMTLLPLEMERDVFDYFEPEVQESILQGSGRERLRDLLNALPSDDRAEYLENLDERVRDQLTALLDREEQEDLRRRERYEDDQVGAILSTEYCVLGPELSAAEAMSEIRRQEPNRETIYYSYVVDEKDRLIGFVSLRDLIMAPDGATVEELMKTDPVSIQPEADQEEASNMIRDYDILALPVIDSEGHLVGIVTHDDAADILEEEDTEDIEKMAGIASETEPKSYTETTVMDEFYRRAGLVAVLAVAFTFVALVIGSYEDNFKNPNAPRSLLALLPMILATGGMVGSQASVLIVRALALKDITPGSLMPIMWKEFRISILLALLLGLVGFGESFAVEFLRSDEVGIPIPWDACLAIAVALAVHVITATLLGALIPLAIAGLRMDPAAAATPTLTTIADFLGAVIYFTVLYLMLPGF
jgi:magnesium transporter